MCDDLFIELSFYLALSAGCFYVASNARLRRWLRPRRHWWNQVRWEHLTAEERAEEHSNSKFAYIFGGVMFLALAAYAIVKALRASS